jgi:chain length determinant protein EpsF
MSFIQFLLILRARLLVVLAIVGVVCATTLVISLLMAKQYTATATVLVDAKGIDPVTGVTTSMLQPSYMATQVDIASSERVATRVVKTLKLDEIPQFHEKWEEATQGRGSFEQWLADMVGKRLSIKPSRESNVLSVEFKWPDAKASALFANAFAEAYIDTSLELKVEPAKQYATFFADRAKQIRSDLETAQKKLSDYQRENGITAADERLDVETARLNELSSQLVAIQSQRMETQSRQREAGNKETMTEVLQNSLISNLKGDLARAEAKREDVVARLGKNHPEYQRTESEIASLREKIERETARVISSLSTNMQANVQRESELKTALEAQKKKLLELKNQRDQLTVLQNDVTNAQHAYDAINQRMTQSSLESQSQQANIVLLTRAYEPTAYSSPKILLNMFLAIVFGLFLGAGTAMMLELFNPCVRGAQDLQALLKLPVLGTLQRKGEFRVGRGKSIRFWRRAARA